MNKTIERAEKKHQDTAEHLMSVIKEQYPIYSTVSVSLGGRNLLIQITGYSESWWCDPTYVHETNTKTGKERKFPASDISYIAVKNRNRQGTK